MLFFKYLSFLGVIYKTVWYRSIKTNISVEKRDLHNNLETRIVYQERRIVYQERRIVYQEIRIVYQERRIVYQESQIVYSC